MVRVGIIGAGPNGRGHARGLHRSGRSRVVAVADPQMDRAQAVASEVGAAPVADYRAFLGDVDAVVISSPNYLHREHAMACAEAGKHVYCEKPMGLTAMEAAEIAEAVRRAGVKCTVGFSVRFGSVAQTMLRVLHEGRTGELVSVWSRRMTHAPARPGSWRSDHALSGGVLMEINVHELDWMVVVGGDVESVYARTYAAKADCPLANDHLWAVLSFAGGAVGTHEGSWVSPVPDFYRGLFGTRGGLHTTEWGNKLMFTAAGAKSVEVPLAPSLDLREHFLDCIEHDAQPLADAEWGLKIMKVADAILESGRSGRVVDVG